MLVMRNHAGMLCVQTPPLGSRSQTDDRKEYACRHDHAEVSDSFMMMLRSSRKRAALFMGLVRKSAGFLSVDT